MERLLERLRMTFPITDAHRRSALPGRCPGAADVVVIGGGVIGVMTAWFLRERGLSVIVCEKGRIAGEQSSRNWGWVRQQGRDPAELPIMVESLSIWKRLAPRLGDGLGLPADRRALSGQDRAARWRGSKPGPNMPARISWTPVF